jgi:tetratricopeptide (TPR) repeat protein
MYRPEGLFPAAGIAKRAGADTWPKMPVAMRLGVILLGGLGAVSGLAGCSTTQGTAASSIWPTTSTSSDNDPVKLRDPVKVHVAFGQWNERAGNSKAARESYQEAIEKNPKSVDALLGLARLDILGGRLTEAEATIAKAFKQAPRDPQVRAAKGQLYEARGDWEAAIAEYRAAVHVAPEDAGFRFQLGTALAKSGDYAEALTELTRAQGPAVAHYNLGYILHEKGDRAAAEVQFAKALQFNPELEAASTILAQYRGARSQIADAALAGAESGLPVVKQVSGQVSARNSHDGDQPFRAENTIYRSETIPPPSGLSDAQQEQWMNQNIR